MLHFERDHFVKAIVLIFLLSVILRMNKYWWHRTPDQQNFEGEEIARHS